MTEEQKQALIEEGNRILKHGYGTKKSDELIKIALAALTAPPVKLPGISDLIEYSGCMPNIRDVSMWSEAIKLCAENIRAAGYEVQE